MTKDYVAGTDASVGHAVQPDYLTDAKFLPNAHVFSKLWHTRARVQAVVKTAAGYWYQIKYDGGVAIVPEGDLSVRSTVAAKTGMNSNPTPTAAVDIPYTPEQHRDEIVEQTKVAHEILKAMCLKFKDVQTLRPEDIEPAIMGVRQVLGTQPMRLALSGAAGGNRKYYRAVQKALSALGACRTILDLCYEDVNRLRAEKDIDRQAIAETWLDGQMDAHDRLVIGKTYLEQALVDDGV